MKLSHALALQLLYRLVRLRVDTRLWSAVFGGGARKLLRVATNVITPSVRPSNRPTSGRYNIGDVLSVFCFVGWGTVG